jgi:hypothetical protein
MMAIYEVVEDDDVAIYSTLNNPVCIYRNKTFLAVIL